MLSPRQKRLLKAVWGWWDGHHYAPTLRELQQLAVVSTTSLVAADLDKLQEAGLVDRERGIARTVRLTYKGRHHRGTLDTL